MVRKTPEDDFERLAERLYFQDGENISDRDTFNFYYQRYLVDVEGSITNANNESTVWAKYSQRYDVVTPSVFKKAGGKDFERDKAKTAKTVVTSRREYVKRGASNVDLRGYDTPKPRKSSVAALRKELNIKARFVFPGKQKGAVRHARKISIMVKGKRQVRFIDKHGRYVGVRKQNRNSRKKAG